MTVEIPLSNGMAVLIDDEDAAFAREHRWYPMKASSGHTWYASTSVKRADGTWGGRLMHTMLTGWQLVDHRNGNGLDNRRANLRCASREENARNGRKRKGTTSRYKGVHRPRSAQRWQAKIYVSERDADGVLHRRGIHLGSFSSETMAAHAYDDAARRYFGEYAAVNFPTGAERSALAPDPPTPTTTDRQPPKVRRMNDELRAEARRRVAGGESIKQVAVALGFSSKTISYATRDLPRRRTAPGEPRRHTPLSTSRVVTTQVPATCRRGHLLDRDSLYISADGGWRCRECLLARQRSYYRRKTSSKER